MDPVLPEGEILEFFYTKPAIDDAAVSKLAEELKVFYTYAILTPRNNSVYVGLSRQHPYKKMDNKADTVRWAPEFEGFWGCYDLVVLNSELNQAEAVEAEKRIIKRIREGTRYKPINKSDGGELGYSLKQAISNAAKDKYYSYLRQEVSDQRYWSFGVWEMDPRPVLSNENPLPMPSKYFRTITECIEEVAQALIAEHLEYVALYRNSNCFATERDELLAWPDCI